MTDLIHVMLDLETWGTAPGHDLRSIGACVFDPLADRTAECRTCDGRRRGGGVNDAGDCSDCLNTGIDHGNTFYMATDNPLTVHPEIGFMNSLEEWRRYDLDRDPATVQWWNDQSADAQAAFSNPIELSVALLAFADWLCGLDGGAYHTHDGWRPSPSIRLWSHGPAFDPPILAAAFKAAGMILPWHYRAPRDTRTAFDIAGINDDGDGSYRTFMSAFNTGTHHHALDDAIAQARSVCGAYKRTREFIAGTLITATVEHDGHLGIAHDTNADWNNVYSAHVRLRDHLNDRIDKQAKCPVKREPLELTADMIVAPGTLTDERRGH